MVLLHGINSSWRIWRPVIPLLEHRHDLYVPTLPGHRGAPQVPAGADFPAVADALERMLDAAGIGRAHLVGNSLGGWLALELARRGRATSVVAFSPAGSWQDARDLRRLAMLMRNGRRLGVTRLATLLMQHDRLRRNLMRMASERADLIPASELAGILEDLRYCQAMDGILAGMTRHGQIRAPVVAVDCPVRLVWPARDRTIPFERYGRSLVELIPDVDLVTLPGIGHVPMYDDPPLVATTITDFTDRHGSPTAVHGGTE